MTSLATVICLQEKEEILRVNRARMDKKSILREEEFDFVVVSVSEQRYDT